MVNRQWSIVNRQFSVLLTNHSLMVQESGIDRGTNRKSKIQNSQESGPVPGDGTWRWRRRFATRASSIQNPKSKILLEDDNGLWTIDS
jgi:hypothetical protein